VTAFPDWFHENAQSYWDDEFTTFFNKDTGVDIDALWIDMNEPSNFCEYPCDDPEAEQSGNTDIVSTAEKRDLESEGVSEKAIDSQVVAPRVKKAKLQHDTTQREAPKSAPRQASGSKKGLPGRDLINPAYKIKNEFGSLSNKTANTDLIHQGGYAEYDTHNL
jgi:alpha-glucosidase